MLESLFAPRGVAVIGVSQNPNKLGFGVARNLIVSGYQGALHFVNPNPGVLFGRSFYPDVELVPDPVDLAVIIIPAQAVPEALEACGRRGIRTVIICSGGFREVGADGLALENRCLEIVRRHGIRALGPNCIGTLDTHLPIDTSFLPLPGPLPGDIAFLSHSGAICEAAIDWARGQGFGLSRLVSLGNQMDLNEADLLPPTAGDPHTHVVAMYLEGVRDGRAFIEAARRVTREKPVVAIKVGRTASGRAAVASHTGALAGDQTAYEAAFRKAGVLQATSSEAMFDWARALAWCPSPTGNRMAVLTNAGGPGAIAVDALEGECLVLAELGSETQSAMAKLLPAAASLRNPVDMLAAAGPREFADCLSLLLADEGVDAVMVILPPPPMSTAAEVVGAMIPIIQTAAKPVVFALMGEDLVAPAARLLRGARIPDYPFPERAASSLGALVRHAYQGRFAAGDPLQGEEGDREGVAGLLEQARQGADGFIESDQAAEILNAYGIELPASMIATDLQQALDCGERLGFPLALKVRSPDVAHKSDLGGVALNLQTPEALEEAYERVLANVRAAKPQAEMEGVLLQKMVPAGQEVIVGVVRDAQFGPLVMFGSGGVEVEGLDDVAFALAPLTQADIDYVLGSTWAGRRLGGYRNLPAGDRQAVVKALIQIGRLACEQEAIAEVEINPLRVLAPGQGALALDVRLRLADPSEVKHELE